MSLLSIGKSGLFAAQAALATTGHNITNANVAGYSRQTTVQETSIDAGRLDGGGRLLTPGHDGTDGFFVARLGSPC